MNRIIRDFSRCSKFDKLSLLAEVFFRRLWNKADDYGRYDANPKLLKADLFPLRDIRSSDIIRCLQECETAELLVCYQIENEKYLQINEFNQSVRTKNAKYPPMNSNCIANAHQLHSKCSLEDEVEEEVEVKEKNSKKEKFTKPTIDEVKSFITEKNYSVDANRFFSYYESNGWKVGRNPMKNWKMAVGYWNKDNNKQKQGVINYDDGFFNV